MKLLMAVGMTAFVSLAGCKLVKTGNAEGQAPVAGEAGDEARIAALLQETYDAKLVPLLRSKATDLVTLKTELGKSLDEAGKTVGVRAGGAGGSWIFPVKASGKIIEENRQSKAGTASVDIDGDGQADATLQLGTVVKGTALRDVAPSVYDFSKFRDQIEFAKLGRALNDKAVSALPAAGSLHGKTITFVGATSLRSASEKPLIVPVVVEIAP
jgi:predicted lipoprotein